MVLLSVKDDGKGASAETLERLNGNSFTAEPYQASGEAAHGIGLRLVCQIVKAHQGTVQFENLRPHGFLVKIELPI